MNGQGQRILLVGYGNPGRCDDGLGPALAASIEELALPGLTVEADYQLTLEHAHDIAQYDAVIFADADTTCQEPFSFRKVGPSASSGLGSHSVEPGEVVYLARTLFGSTARSYILGIRGYEFNEFGEKLSTAARKNLAAAVNFISTVVRNGNLEEAALDFGSLNTETVPIGLDRISMN